MSRFSPFSPLRRALLLSALAAPTAAQAVPVRRGRGLTFPRDHGAHLDARIEWWYATGWLDNARLGFQVTFFRSRTGLAETPSGPPAASSRFAPRQLLFAHAAITDVAAGRHWHDERIVRWSGDAASTTARATEADADVQIASSGLWRLWRESEAAGNSTPVRWRSRIAARDFTLDLTMTRTQPLLLQGDAGFSRKGPDEAQASHYYSEPQLDTRARVTREGRTLDATGRAWIDQEWSEQILHPEAVGWDWIGMNLLDGSALTAFRLRRRDGTALWAGGSFRAPAAQAAAPSQGTASTNFAPEAVRWTPGRRWRSPATSAEYPVGWRIDTPAGTFEVRALLDAQELDSRGSTGAIYWEGLSELLDAQGRRIGLGYLEMTGYAAPLRLG